MCVHGQTPGVYLPRGHGVPLEAVSPAPHTLPGPSTHAPAMQRTNAHIHAMKSRSLSQDPRSALHVGSTGPRQGSHQHTPHTPHPTAPTHIIPHTPHHPHPPHTSFPTPHTHHSPHPTRDHSATGGREGGTLPTCARRAGHGRGRTVPPCGAWQAPGRAATTVQPRGAGNAAGRAEVGSDGACGARGTRLIAHDAPLPGGTGAVHAPDQSPRNRECVQVPILEGGRREGRNGGGARGCSTKHQTICCLLSRRALPAPRTSVPTDTQALYGIATGLPSSPSKPLTNP
jgi:hypothetical protein